MCLLVFAFIVLLSWQTVKADGSNQIVIKYSSKPYSSLPVSNNVLTYSFSGLDSTSYCVLAEEPANVSGSNSNRFIPLVVSKARLLNLKCTMTQTSDQSYGIDKGSNCNMIEYECSNGGYVYYAQSQLGIYLDHEGYKFYGDVSPYFYLCNKFELNHKGFDELCKYFVNGEKIDGIIANGSDTEPTAVTNESIGYLQDVKLNLSYVTPIKGDSIFETTNYQIYTDMIYNLKWNSKKTSTNYDLSSSYVQLYAKAEYSKSEYDNVSTTDFIELGDYEKASKGKLKFSFIELFEKSNNCKSAYLSDHLLASADYKNGKLQACSVTPNIKYKFYIRVYKGTEKGPWLCVSEKGSHHSNEFVNSGVKVPFNVSSGGLDSDGTYKPDGNINENGNGITGTGTDRDDADADANANDKIQSKHDSSNTTFDKLEEFVQGIGDMPKMIADIFSFLPSWCLDVVGIGFSLLMILIVVKFIRG